MQYAIAKAEPAALEVSGSSQLFPVRRVYCVGRNYADHVREMGFDPSREPPFFFCKPNDTASVVACTPDHTEPLPYPPGTEDYQFEGELVVAIGKAGKDIEVQDALGHVWGYAAGLDMTRRDLQVAARKAGRPWETGKSFDYSAPISQLVPAAVFGDIRNEWLELKVDGLRRQAAELGQMIWSVPEIVSRLSSSVELQPGDIIFTGTPSGVGAVRPGETIELTITGLPALRVLIV